MQVWRDQTNKIYKKKKIMEVFLVLFNVFCINKEFFATVLLEKMTSMETTLPLPQEQDQESKSFC